MSDSTRKLIHVINNVLKVLNEGKRKADLSRVLKFLKKRKAFDILDTSKAPNTTFQFGGCWILADALSMYYDLPVYVVYNKKYGRIEHFVVEVNRNFLDSDGMQSNYSLIDKVAKDGFYNPEDLEVIEYNENLNHADIVRDLDVSKKFVDEFNKLS